jgi:hypothetical protein
VDRLRRPAADAIQHNSGSSGVFEFYRTAAGGATNQATIFQETGVAVDAGVPLLAEFDLGNSSTVRKRISVLLLAHDFSDLSVCTFWLAPNATTPKRRTTLSASTGANVSNLAESDTMN